MIICHNGKSFFADLHKKVRRGESSVCRSKACQLDICSNIYLTPYNIFARGTPNGVSFALCRKRFINVEFLIYCIKNTNAIYAGGRTFVQKLDFICFMVLSCCSREVIVVCDEKDNAEKDNTLGNLKLENAKLMLDSAKLDYDRQWSRKAKLDSKANVTLTISGVYASFFTFLYNLSNIFSKSKFTKSEVFVISIYLFFIVTALMLFICGVAILLYIIKANKYRVPNTYGLYKEKMLTVPTSVLCQAYVYQIIDSVHYNNFLLNKLFMLYNKSLICIVISIIMAVLGFCVRINCL